jgi:hypothetical protein
MTILPSILFCLCLGQPVPSFDVWATREGLVGCKTATGHVIASGDVFVALPSRSALNRQVAVTYRGRTIVCPVLDVGPHNTTDAYWDGEDGVPAAAKGIRLGKMAKYGPPKNPAGIDLSDGACRMLGIKNGTIVRWRFTK